MSLKLTGKKKKGRRECQRQPFTVFLLCQDCDEQIEIGDELVDVQMAVNVQSEGMNTRMLMVTGPAVCPTCKNMKVVDGDG